MIPLAFVSRAVDFARIVGLCVSLGGEPSTCLDVAGDVMHATPDRWSGEWLIVTGFEESRFQVSAVGGGGMWRGYCQLAAIWGPLPDDREGEMEQCLEVFAMLVDTCGTRRRAESAFLTGSCDLDAEAARRRCDLIPSGCGSPALPNIPRARE